MTNTTTAPRQPRQFSDNWAITDVWDIKKASDEQQTPYAPEMVDAMEIRLQEHIAWLATQGRLHSPPFSDAFKINWLYAWNKVIEQSQDPTQALDDDNYWDLVKTATRPFYGILRWNMFFDIQKATTPEEIETIYNKTLQTFMKGDFDHFAFEGIGECFYTGVQMRMQTRNWVPELGVWERGEKLGQGTFKPIEKGPDLIHYKHDEVTFPSGEIVFADWVRLEAFTQFGKTLDHNDNISSQLGCAQRTSKYASNSIIHVFAGNSSPEIVQDGEGRWVAGRIGEDHEDIRNKDIKAKVCTDLWWVTGVDKQTLIDIVHKDGKTMDEAQHIVDAHIKTERLDVVRMEPGTYHLYSALCHSDLFKQVHVEEIEHPEHFERANFILSKEPLTVEPLVKSANKPRPKSR